MFKILEKVTIMKDDSKVTIIILFIIMLIILSIIPLTVHSDIFENQYGKLEVYPTISRNIIRQKQFFNATSYLPSQDLDIAFRFNESLTYGEVYSYNGTHYNKLNVEYIEYNDKHWYLLENIYFNQDETRKGYWEYDTPINTSGKWDMFIKRSSDTLQYAIDNDLFVHLDPFWNSSWKFKNETVICNNITDYSMQFNFSYTDFFNSKCQSDFDDIRFIGSNTTELYYYYYAKSNSDYIAGFVNISNHDFISIYYNNTDATESVYMDGSKTFKYMFEPFENLDDWTEVENPADPGSDWSIVSDELYADANTGDAFIYYDVEHFGNLVEKQVIYMTVHSTNIGICQLRAVNNIIWGDDDVIRIANYDIQSGGGSTTSIEGDIRYSGVWEEDIFIIADVGDEIFVRDLERVGIDENSKARFYVDDTYKGVSTNSIDDNNYYVNIYNNNGRGLSKWYVDDCAVAIFNDTEPTFCDWSGEIEYIGCECLISNENYTNGSTNIEGSLDYYNLTISVNSSCGVFDYVNISFLNISHNISSGINGTYYLNYTYALNCSTFPDIINHTWYVNTSCNDTLNFTYYWFTMEVCSAGGGCECDEIEEIIDNALIEYNALKGDDELEISIGLDGTLLTLVLFAIFFIIGYIINKRSGGILMIFSGFSLISFEYLVSSASILNAVLVIPLLSPIAILIIVLGVRKWLYPVENEYTKSEGK